MTCVRCNGTGLIELTGGTHTTGHWLRGEYHTSEVEATPEKPVYKRCGCAPVLTPVVPHYQEQNQKGYE